MATLLNRSGKWTVLFRIGHKQHGIGLGGIGKQSAERVKVRLEQWLSETRVTGQPSPESTAWLAGLGVDLRRRLANAGIGQNEMTVADLVRRFESQAGRKDSTMVVNAQTTRNLIECYGGNTPASQVDASKFRPFLVKQGLSQATINKRVSVARGVFKPVTPNPFAAVVAGQSVNTRRQQYITTEAVEELMQFCDDELKLALAFARFAGLRIPSELVGLRWQDFQFSRNRFTARSPKTERHEGGDRRVVPIFPGLRAAILPAFGATTDGSGYLFPRQSEVSNAALRRRLSKVFKRLKLKPWPRLFQNLRASWVTDIARMEPAAAGRWAGHSLKVAQMHYHMVDEAAFERISSVSTPAQTSSTINQCHALSQTTTGSVSDTGQSAYNTTNLSSVGLEPSRRALRKPLRVNTGANKAIKLGRIYQRISRRTRPTAG